MSSSIVVPSTDSIANYPPAIAAALNAVAQQAQNDINLQQGVCRAVITSLSGAYGGSTTGVLTASANAAFGAQDGVTCAVGDVVFLPGAAANISAASDAGPYVITNLGSVSTKWVLTRPSWFATGATVALGKSIAVGGEGTKFGAIAWKSYAVQGSAVVDTNDLKFYPQTTNVTTVAAIAGVTAANSTLYVAPNAVIIPVPVVAGGTQGTWRMTTSTVGYAGTSSLVATSSSNTDTSTVKLIVVNF